MKGMLMKDLLTMRKSLWIYLIMIVGFSAWSGVSGTVFAMFYGIMLPVNLIAMDERSRFERLMPMLPGPRINCVLDKYIVAWVCLILAIISGAVAELTRGGVADYVVLVVPGLALCLLSQAITLPLIFRFGVEKGRMIYLISIVAQAAVLGALGSLFDKQVFISVMALSLIALAVAAAINVGSVFLSERLYFKRLTA